MTDDSAITSMEDIEARFVTWAQGEDAMRAAFVVGSRARVDHPADAWSDLDIILFANGIEAYQNSTDWIGALAPIWITLYSRTVAGDPERLVLFEGGFQVDFVFHEAAILAGVRQMVESDTLPDIIRRGIRILFDKDAQLLTPEPAPLPARTPPSEGEFRGWLDGFWFGAVHTAKQGARGDLVSFKGGEVGLRNQLLPLIEWHTRATYGWNTDTWHNARFLKEWADPRVYAALQATYTSFDAAATWHGLLTLLDMVRWTTGEIAAHLGFAHPIEAHEQAYRFVCGLSEAEL
jgi:aminoglycoside 6-adenylyltransferase